MKYTQLILWVMGCLLSAANIEAHTQQMNERKIVVVTASYNNKDWYKRSLDSVFSQKYENYELVYVDDCSPDGTGKLVKEYVAQCGQQERVTLLCNLKQMGAMANQYMAIHACDDNAIIIILDGDDWLAHDGVFAYINRVYSEEDVWLTYGQFQEYPSGQRGFCCPMPTRVVQGNAFRDFANIPSHLRTFYAGLFKKIKKEDLMYEGLFLPMTCDIAAMFPMIEMARDHFKFTPDVLLTYNAANVLNDHKVSKTLQRKMDLLIRSRPRYSKIQSPFSNS